MLVSRFWELSDQKRSKLQAAGKCFICEKIWHFSRNCPEANKVSGLQGKRPPGTAAFSVEPEFADIEDLRALANSINTADEL